MVCIEVLGDDGHIIKVPKSNYVNYRIPYQETENKWETYHSKKYFRLKRKNNYRKKNA